MPSCARQWRPMWRPWQRRPARSTPAAWHCWNSAPPWKSRSGGQPRWANGRSNRPRWHCGKESLWWLMRLPYLLTPCPVYPPTSLITSSGIQFGSASAGISADFKQSDWHVCLPLPERILGCDSKSQITRVAALPRSCLPCCAANSKLCVVPVAIGAAFPLSIAPMPPLDAMAFLATVSLGALCHLPCCCPCAGGSDAWEFSHHFI